MSETLPTDLRRLPLEAGQNLDAICERFEAAWRGPSKPRIEDFLSGEPESDFYPVLERELILLEIFYRRRDGEVPTPEEYAARFPKLERSWLENAFQEQALDGSGQGLRGLETTLQGQAGDPLPAHERYHVESTLGKGGFGTVYLARDEQLRRQVAIKVPHPKLVSRPEDAEAYLTEARTVANLDHPNIVPVYDVGSTPAWPCFIVSKFIEGGSLAQKIKGSRPPFGETAELVATIAEALHYAHGKGLVHRDIKPANVLIETSGKPFLVDFGLALKEENVGQGPKYAGTPAYMSPEQARGEGHRVDGRSDIFSLGVVFYELLAGRRPFGGQSPEELMEQVANHEPRPPRQMDDAIPKELERVCFKALSKRASERYLTAKDMADDLRYFLDQGAPDHGPAVALVPNPISSTNPGSGTTAASDSQPIRIVPKGLRSFDEHDTDFFLELLPGPRDRNGLPDSLRFWKTRIEETDPEKTFTVGLICGPSGCGKSSLVKAGLLPRLSREVITVYLEATGADTEARLLNGLRKQFPALPASQGLPETLAALRLGQGITVGKKVLIVLDQFEQWLHALASRERERPERGPESANTELIQALRQCDGSHVQCVVMVRDDFWMAIIRFMRELEIPLMEGRNSAAVDLFDPDHAEKVLAAFGRAFGKLPGDRGATTKEQNQFVNQAVQGLAHEGKVICVRLALFAEMMKAKPWTPATLKVVGGAAGVGVTFLEETFSAAGAPPEYRYHQKAARAVLKGLLPEAGADIKGSMRTYTDLLEASEYGGRSRDFDDLMRILDSEVRLITPADSEEVAGDEGRGPREENANDATFRALGLSSVPSRYYQLTHDYLAPSLREWLTRKQKETRRGRAELRLEEREAAWHGKPDNGHLPAWWEWANIRLFTLKRSWTPGQRRMMRKAGRYHALRGLALTILLTLAGWGLYEGHGTLQAHALKDRLLDADTKEIPVIVMDMAPYRRWIDPLLRDAYQELGNDPRKQLHVSVALLPVDAGQKEYLYTRLLDADPRDVAILRDALAAHKEEYRDKLWAVVDEPGKGQEQRRLRAACALAAYDPESPNWDKSKNKVVEDLVSVNAVFLGVWTEGFRPVKARLLGPLLEVFRDGKTERISERTLATNILADYATSEVPLLADLIIDADDKQFTALFSKLKAHEERIVLLLQEQIEKPPPIVSPDNRHLARSIDKTDGPVKTDGQSYAAKSIKIEDAKEIIAKRRANAAAALLRLDHPQNVWMLLKHSPDPRTRSYLIHRLGPLGVGANLIVRRVEDEPDVTIRRALILSLGQYGDEALLAGERNVFLQRMREIYTTADDPGLHAAVEWLLRQPGWNQEGWLSEMNDAWAKDKEGREKRMQRIRERVASREALLSTPQWYVNPQGQTMVVIPGPVEFIMGSPVSEDKRFESESQHHKRIGRSFAVATKPVTVADILRFQIGRYVTKRLTPTPTCPVFISWLDALAYCNWLSDQEGIPREEWCYEADSQGHVTMLKTNYLSLTGYRLPTESEWEFSCRAGALTSRYFGESEELVGEYGWYIANSNDCTWPVGTKKPNDLGLFDMHGNVYCWCQDKFGPYPKEEASAIPDVEGALDIKITQTRVMRGGAYNMQASTLRCADRYWNLPNINYPNVGFRPVRTFR